MRRVQHSNGTGGGAGRYGHSYLRVTDDLDGAVQRLADPSAVGTGEARAIDRDNGTYRPGGRGEVTDLLL